MQKKSSKSFSESPKKQSKEKTKTETDEKGYWDMMINGIVRPPRAKYNNAQLGKFYIMKGTKYLAIRIRYI